MNANLVLRMNDLIKNREGKTYFKHVKAHSGVHGNEQADMLAFLGSQKEYRDLNLEPIKGKIDLYFKKDKKDDSENGTDSYLLEFLRILNLLEQDADKEKLVIRTRNKNIYMMLEENLIEKWLKNDWCNANKQKLKAPKDICLRINELFTNKLCAIDERYVDEGDGVACRLHQSLSSKKGRLTRHNTPILWAISCRDENCIVHICLIYSGEECYLLPATG
ncbi:13084_t:CDS:2 [Dentiscutata erythropus]|uniref:13084_t:CDS:1 n=1 Tax=Dentiscutata erythropus TaxID=1348616 RepID=A0A9N9J687_9GLOM|nr:13084_t:CDS:2 [Dentiscutata erythropus]